MKTIEHLGKPRTHPKGEVLFTAGEKAHGFYYVVSGEVRLFQADPEGRELEIARMGPGSFLAEVILFASETFPVSAEVSKTAEILYFSKEKVLSEIQRKPETALFFLRLLAGKCLTLSRRLENLNLKNVRDRLVRFLTKESPDRPPYTLTLKTTKTELAKQLGTISKTLSRNFRQLEKEGLIRVKGRMIEIRDLKRLKDALPAD